MSLNEKVPEHVHFGDICCFEAPEQKSDWQLEWPWPIWPKHWTA